ncbi:hypothetical protein [Capnocytophaga sp.]|uniref:hypothetical protein n=1 Tax=Capnocytophaga sp. TaxID=44737 RepID=UPI0026DC1B89|nr:hypothetical protein [Capnocytophaga sp.]MDO5105933.1 hypothetical protein [Capnocytophaga sp.]
MRILKEIHTYERHEKNTSDSWQIFHFEGDTYPGWVFDEQRIASKLAESDFSIGEEDHLYVILNPNIAENSIEFSKLHFDKRTLYADFGVNPQHFNALSQKKKDFFVRNIIFSVLKTKSTPEMRFFLEETQQKIEKHGKNIEILYKAKETSQYSIRIFFQINPEGRPLSLKEKNGGVAIIKYLNKQSGEEKAFRYPLFFYDDIYYLMNAISLKNNEIIIKPKTSLRAEVYNQKYAVPIIFRL